MNSLDSDNESLRTLLRRCTVRIRRQDAAAPSGTGFFVAPGLVLTCAHVVERADERVQLDALDCKPLDGVVKVRLLEGNDYPDLALIEVTSVTSCHQDFVALDPIIRQNEELISNGFTTNYPDGDGLETRYEANFDVLGYNAGSFLKLKQGQVEWGFSGAPLLNKRTGAVSGLIKSTRDFSRALGGRAVSASVVIDKLAALLESDNGRTAGSKDWQRLQSLSCASDASIDSQPSEFFKHWENWANDQLALLNSGDLLQRNIVPSPLECHWADFARSKSWAEHLREQLTEYETLRISSGHHTLPTAPNIEGLTHTQASETVGGWLHEVSSTAAGIDPTSAADPRPSLEGAQADFKQSRSRLRRLLREITRFLDPCKARLALAFLIVGPQGSGKTQFLRTRHCDVTREHDGSRLLLLPLEPWPPTGSLEQLVLDRVSEAGGGHRWRTLSELDAFLRVSESKLVIVVDDFERVLIEQSGGSTTLDFMAQNTRNTSISYLFALQNTFASYLATGAVPWSLYGYDPSTRLGCDQLLMLSGWIDLADLNRQTSIGHTILQKAGQNDAVMILRNGRIQPSPLEAQLILELLLSGDNFEGIASYNFFHFVKNFVSLLAARTAQQEGDAVLMEAMSSVAAAIVDAESLSPSLKLVLSSLAAVTKEPEKRLEVLKRASLVGEAQVDVPGFCFSGSKMRIARVNYPFIWRAALADELWKRFNLDTRESEADVLDWLEGVNDPEFLEGIWEYVLLLADNAMALRQITRLRAQQLWGLAFVHSALPYRSPCFAARWATRRTQRKVATQVKNHASEIVDAGDLFALMFFSIETDQLSSHDRLELVRPFYSEVAKSDLGFYLVYGAKRVLQRITELPHMENCLASLSMSHLSGCQEELAKLAWDRFLTLRQSHSSRQDLIGAFETLIKGYLKYDARNADEEARNSIFDDGRRRRFFRQELIARALRDLLEEQLFPLRAFETLHNLGWYNAESRGISKRIAFEMRSESNLAFGRRFRWLQGRVEEHADSDPPEYAREYAKLVGDLLDGRWAGVSQPEELGYFMLRHTDFTMGKTAHVPESLWEAVDRVKQIPALRHCLERYPVTKRNPKG